MIEDMTVRITEAELARDLHAVLENLQQGSEVIVEREDYRPVAVISSPPRSGRLITEICNEAKQRNSTVTLDESLSKDLEPIPRHQREP